MREVIVPHELSVGPLTAVRRVLIQSSLASLQDLGHFDRYRAAIEPDILAQLTDAIGPGWVPVELALAHYRACDALKLNATEMSLLGGRVGERVQSALLVLSKSMVDQPALAPWPAMSAFARMRRRMLQGSSSEYVKVSHTELLIEILDNVLLGVPYYRGAFASWLCAALRGLGVEVTTARISSYRKDGMAVEIRLSW
jgi:hypothetical protein